MGMTSFRNNLIMFCMPMVVFYAVLANDICNGKEDTLADMHDLTRNFLTVNNFCKSCQKRVQDKA